MSATTPTTKSPTTSAATINERGIDCNEMRDEVDFVKLNNNNNHNKIQTNNKVQQIKVKENQEQNNIKRNEKTTTTTEHNTNKYTTKERRLSLFSFSKKLSHKNHHQHQQPQQQQNVQATANGTNINNNNNNNNTSSKDKSNETTTSTPTPTPFSFSCQPPTVPIGTPPRQHRHFVKNSSSSLARLFSSTYNAKKFEKEEEKRLANAKKFHTYGGRRRSSGPYLERFKKAAKEDAPCDASASSTTADVESKHATEHGTLTRKKRRNSGSCSELATLEPYEERHEDLGVRALRTLSRGLGKLWWKRSHSVEISTPDPEFKVAYLGNVLTGWAKGEGCVEKQLATLWRNYTQNNKPDVVMRIKVCASGLKATTRQHGLTEYWANRITHCCAPKNYPRVFCWIYRHEGRKLKHELRCHAVMCSKEKIVHEICDTLKENLECALREFKRDKILKQNARLSLANAAYDNPSLPRRKILLSVGGNNYRPPLERSKSAPKLMAIEEAIGEEEGEEVEETNEPEMKPCCQRDSLYPAMTLGRRHCRRGHSIRRTGKARPCFGGDTNKNCCGSETNKTCESNAKKIIATPEEHHNSYGSNDSDDFEKLLKQNNYDSNASLATELMPYFDLQLNKNKSSSLSSLHELKDAIDEEAPLSLVPTINTDPNADPEADLKLHDQANESLCKVNNEDDDILVALRRPGICSDGEDDYLDDTDDADVRYFRQQSILNILHRNSMRKMAQLSLSSDENSSLETHTPPHPVPQYRHQLQSSISSNASSTTTTTTTEGSNSVGNSGEPKRKQFQLDSDEGSISSGCETASTVTTPNQDDISLQYRRHSNQQGTEHQHGLNGLPLHTNIGDMCDIESPVSAEEIYQRLEARLNGRHNSDATTFSSSSSITLKMSNSPTTSVNDLTTNDNFETSQHKSKAGHVARAVRRLRRASAQYEKHDSDSECSDESGYVEYQEREKRNSKQDSRHKSAAAPTVSSTNNKPQPPPKPMPRRFINGNSTTTTV